MGLSNDLVSQFVKAVNPENSKPKETTAYGTIKVSDGKTYVTLDGSTMDTPISSTTDAKHGDRVMVLIKDHSAVVTGNLTKPSINENSEIKNRDETTIKISELGIVLADKVNTKELNAETARIDTLYADVLEVEEVEVDGELKAKSAKIDKLEGGQAEFDKVKTDVLEVTFVEVDGNLVAKSAKIETLEATDADFRKVESDYGVFKILTTGNFEAVNADIENLDTSKLSADFANINFAELNTAEIKKLYAASGLITDVTADEVTTTYLVGVTIKGDLIEAGTLKADQLVVRGTDGNYYKLNTDFSGLESVEPMPEDAVHGSVIVAKSLTAEKINVSDLVAFGATIGGFMIRGDAVDEETGEVIPGAIHSVDKPSIDATTRGSYLDSAGQFSFGDNINYIKYYKTTDENGNEVYKLAISADSITFGQSGKTAEDIANLADRIKMGSYTDPDTGETKPSIELDEEFGEDKLQLTNETMVFTSGETEGTKITKDKISTETVEQKGWVWEPRANGNYGLVWKGVTN